MATKKPVETHHVMCQGEALVPPRHSPLYRLIKENPGRYLDIVVKGHSDKHHRLLFSYLQWAWGDYWRDQIPSFDTFRDEISRAVGWVEVKEFINFAGEHIKERVPKSWSMDSMTQAQFTELTRLVSEFIGKETGIDLETWKAKKAEYIDSAVQ